MSIQTVYVLIGVFAAILAGLYIFVIYSKIAQAHRTKVQATYTQTIRPAVEDLSTAPDADYSELHQAYVAAARKNMKKRHITRRWKRFCWNIWRNPAKSAGKEF